MHDRNEELITLCAEVVAAHVAHNNVALSDMPKLITSVYASFAALSAPAVTVAVPKTQEPAVAIRNSVKPDYIICLEDGKKFKMLKRHLRGVYAMSPDDYRAKWGLPATYPMVAPNYAEARRALAVKIGLGRKRGPRAASKA